jgi:uncharacterized membrane protein
LIRLFRILAMRKISNTSTLVAVFASFIFLKLNGNIDWSWWIVLSPMWISAIVVFTIFMAIGIVMVQDESIYNKWEDDEDSNN